MKSGDIIEDLIVPTWKETASYIESIPWLTAFYFGDEGLKQKVATRLDEIDPREVGTIPVGEDDSGEAVVARIGRYGPYVQIGEERASIPDDVAPDELTVDKAVELGEQLVGLND